MNDESIEEILVGTQKINDWHAQMEGGHVHDHGMIGNHGHRHNRRTSKYMIKFVSHRTPRTNCSKESDNEGDGVNRSVIVTDREW